MKPLFKIYLPLILGFICSTSFSQTWPKYYTQTDSYDYSDDIIEMYDKGYLICGNYNTYNGSEYKQWSWLIKTDINGNILWDKIIAGGDDFIRTLAIESTADGGVLTCGLIWTSSGFSDPYVMKINACGVKEWCKIFTGSVNDNPSAQDIKETSTGEIIVLINYFEELETLHIFKLSTEGDYLWKKPYCIGSFNPGSYFPYGNSITLLSEEKCILSAEVYWEDPWNPGGPAWLRPLFVAVDESGNEEWVMPFGLQDTIYGQGYTVHEINNNRFIGVAVKWNEPSSQKTPVLQNMLIEFDSNGYVNQHIIIDNVLINPDIETSVTINFERIGSLYVMGGLYGIQNVSRSMEVIIDTNIFNNFSVLKNFLHLNDDQPYSMTKSFDNKILINSSFIELDNIDITLSKLNTNLEYDTAYNGNFTYDSLCFSGPPQSGFIYLDDCDIITGTKMPSPEEYYSFIGTIPITAYPNPAETEITLAFENTEHHTNMLLVCYNIYGQRVHSEKIWKGQQQTKLDVSGYAKGLYFAVVKSEWKVAGTGRFVRK